MKPIICNTINEKLDALSKVPDFSHVANFATLCASGKISLNDQLTLPASSEILGVKPTSEQFPKTPKITASILIQMMWDEVQVFMEDTKVLFHFYRKNIFALYDKLCEELCKTIKLAT